MNNENTPPQREDEDHGWLLDYKDYNIATSEGPERQLYPGDFTPSPEVEAPSPLLTNRPLLASVWPIAWMIALAYVSSYYHWGHPGALSVSGHKAFVLGEYWRGVTALFAHGDFAHFLGNSWLLLVFGFWLHHVGGLLAFPWVSVVVGVLTNLTTVAIYPPQVHLVGASGMAYAMVGMWLTWFLRYDSTPLAKRWLRVVAFTLVVMFPTTFRPEVSYLAHGIGFVYGVIAGLLFRPRVS